MDEFEGTCPRCGSYDIKFPRIARISHNYGIIMRVCHCCTCQKDFTIKNRAYLRIIEPTQIYKGMEGTRN